MYPTYFGLDMCFTWLNMRLIDLGAFIWTLGNEFLFQMQDKYSYDGLSFPMSYAGISKIADMYKTYAYMFVGIDEEQVVKSFECNIRCLLNAVKYLIKSWRTW